MSDNQLDRGAWAPGVVVEYTVDKPKLNPALEAAEKQFLTYAVREADTATADYQQSKSVYENAAENYQAKVSIVRGFLDYLAKKYNLSETQDIDEQGNIITRSQ